MKKILYTLLALSTVTACKKNAPSPGRMTVYVNGDSSWSTTNVVTQNDHNGTVNIIGTSADATGSVMLTLNAYRPGDGTYQVLNTGVGVNVNYSNAMYVSDSIVVYAEYGHIVVSGYTSQLTSGSFTFNDNNNIVAGTYTAPSP